MTLLKKGYYNVTVEFVLRNLDYWINTRKIACYEAGNYFYIKMGNDMSERFCPICHAELDPEVLGGLCPACVLNKVLAEPVKKEQVVQTHPEVVSCSINPEGRRFGNYEILEFISQGAMGIVYKARQINLDRIVALKLIQAGRFASQEDISRFLNEARAAANLQHPNIVTVHDVGECDGQYFYSMDYVNGVNLAEMVRDKPLSAQVAARYIQQTAEAIHYAHQHAIVHRDIKPTNILIDEQDQPRILDFGLAKFLDANSDLTKPWHVLGTPPYMPPEQFDNQTNSVGPPNDIYSLGATLYRLLTGRPPFLGDTNVVIDQLRNAEPVSLRILNPSVPRDLETICLKCLVKEPRQRYGTAQELADDLKRWQAGCPILARPIGPLLRFQRWVRRNPWASALIFSLAVGFITTIWFLWAIEQKNRDNVEARRKIAITITKLGKVFQENRDKTIMELTNIWWAVDDRKLRKVLVTSLQLHSLCIPHLEQWEIDNYLFKPSFRGPTNRFCVAVYASDDPIKEAETYGRLLNYLECTMSKKLKCVIELDLIIYADEVEGREALGTGVVDIMRLGAVNLFLAREKEPQIQALIEPLSQGKSAGFMTFTNSPIRIPADLKSARIGLGAENSSISLEAIRKIHEEFGLPINDMQIEFVEDPSDPDPNHTEIIDGLLTNRFDVVVVNMRYLTNGLTMIKGTMFSCPRVVWAAKKGADPDMVKAFSEVMASLPREKWVDDLRDKTPVYRQVTNFPPSEVRRAIEIFRQNPAWNGQPSLPP